MRCTRLFLLAVTLVAAVCGLFATGASAQSSSPASVLWAKQYAPSSGEDAWQASAVRRDGNLIVAGTSRAGSNGADIVVACYARDGGRRWLRRVALAGPQETKAIALGRRGDVFVAASRIASDASDRDVLLVRLSPAGVVRWKAYYRSARDEYPIGVGLDSAGNAYVAGTCGTTTRREDFLLVKFSPAGERLWKSTWDDGNSSDWCRAMHVTARGVTYLTGQVSSTSEILVPLVCVRASGQIAWTRTVPLDSNGVEEGRAIAVRGTTVVVAAAVTTMAHIREAWVASYDTAGGFRWAQGWWRTGDHAWPNAVAVDADGDVAVAGLVEHAEGGTLPLQRGFYFRRAADGELLSAAFFPAVATATTTAARFEDMELAPDGSAYCAGNTGGDPFVAKFSATGGLAGSGIVGGDDTAGAFRSVSVARADGVTLVYACGWTYPGALAARYRP